MANTNKTQSQTALALAVTPGVVGYNPEEVKTLRQSTGLPTRIRNIKSDALFALSADIMNTVRTGESALMAQSVLLAKVKKHSLFLTEGFDNFKEFAENMYGINGPTAYNRAQVGAAIYGDKEIPESFKSMPVSSLERIASLKTDDLHAAIKSGRITPDMGQMEIRDIVKTIKSESGTAKASKAKTTFPLNVECIVNDHWSLLASCKSLKAAFNAKEIATALPTSDWTGSYVKHPGEFDRSEIHIIAERHDGVWYHLRITKAVAPAKVDKSAKTLTPISADEFAELIQKVARGEITMEEVNSTFTVKVEK